MKKLSILAAVLAIGTMWIAGCDMGNVNSVQSDTPETQNIIVQDENADATVEPNQGDDCEHGGDCNRNKVPHKKPDFKFKTPHGKRDKKGRNKFRHPHKRPKPVPEDPETPTVPEENNNN